MKSPRRSYSTFAFRSVIGIVVLIALLATLTPLFARQDQDDFPVYPADSIPFGMTYGDWNAAWIQYGLSIPASINPTLDTTGVNCSVAQSGGPVFSFPGASPVIL